MNKYSKIKKQAEGLLGQIEIEQRKLSFVINRIKHAFVRVEGENVSLVSSDIPLAAEEVSMFSRWVSEALPNARAIREKITKLEKDHERLTCQLQFIDNCQTKARILRNDGLIELSGKVTLTKLKEIAVWAEDLLK